MREREREKTANEKERKRIFPKLEKKIVSKYLYSPKIMQCRS